MRTDIASGGVLTEAEGQYLIENANNTPLRRLSTGIRRDGGGHHQGVAYADHLTISLLNALKDSFQTTYKLLLYLC
jgi:hypothetical protein